MRWASTTEELWREIEGEGGMLLRRFENSMADLWVIGDRIGSVLNEGRSCRVSLERKGDNLTALLLKIRYSR